MKIDLTQILNKLGFAALNTMQSEVYDTVLHGRNDVVVLSPTGSGKTLAYLLPLMELLDAASEDVQALVIVPGRELSLQSSNVMQRIGGGLRCQSCYGGRVAMDEHRQMKTIRPHVIFGTPGRLNDHLSKGNISADHIRYLVIDEFDKCLEMGFQDEMSRLIGRLPFLERRILLSATDAEQIPRFVELRRTTRLNYLIEDEVVSERVEAYEVKCQQKDKLLPLKQLLIQLGEQQSVVFLNYRDSVERVSQYLREQGFVVSSFHGGMEQREREEALYKFSNGSTSILVSTDLASRGLDIPKLDNVIHYHLPMNEDALVHRVGRTARWDAIGRTFFLVGPEEQFQLPNLSLVSYRLDQQSDKLSIPVPQMATLYVGKGKKDKISKGDIVGFLCKSGGLEPSEIGRIDVLERYAYVAVHRSRVQQVLRNVKGQKIKGIRTIVEPA